MKPATVRSADGTTIAFETAGDGPPLILVGGAFCDRHAQASGTPLAAKLSSRFSVVSYDRRRRGDSTDNPPYAIEREVEDLRALIKQVGGAAGVYGLSSGAFLALEAAKQGAAVTRLALYEPPVVLDAARASKLEALAHELDDACAQGRGSDAVEMFFTRGLLMPAQAVAGMKQSPGWRYQVALASSLSCDLRLTERGSRLAEMKSLRVPTLALEGGSSPPWMREAVKTLANAIPNARTRTLEGQTHDVNLDVLADALAAFFGG